MSSADREPVPTVRPALQTLSKQDLRSMREALLDGFGSRTDVLRWLQELTVRTLGRLPTEFYVELARQFRPRRPENQRYWRHADATDRQHGVLLDVLLEPEARCRDLDDAKCREARERCAATFVRPATHQAFRALRKDAGEYIDESDEDTAHNPEEQQHIAMRPFLTELDEYQKRALEDLLAGFAERKAIIAWGDRLDLATNGELEQRWVERCYKEETTAELLLADGDRAQWAREVVGAVHLLPAFNAGVRDGVGRSAELPDADKDPQEATPV